MVIGIAGVKLGGAAVGIGVFPPPGGWFIGGGEPGQPNPGGGEPGPPNPGGKN